ncbi:MAG: hypothetical protein WCR55_00725 [Lentisphaerota bacterium]
MRTIWVFSTIIFLASSFALGTQTITATLQGPRLIFIADEGTVVKKGEPLAKYRTASIEAQIKSAQASLSSAEENLKDKKGNYERYKDLKEGNSVSVEKLEDVDLAYDEAIAKVADCKADLKEYQNVLAVATIAAPYDCKVSKTLIAANSGTEYGTQIMEITSDSNADTSTSESSASTQAVTSPMKGGVINYLAKEGAVIKKGELLVKIYNPVTVDMIDALKADITGAEHALIDKESKYKRYSKLRENKSTSLSDFENTELAYNKAKYTLADSKEALNYFLGYNASGTIVAPYDCKVTTVMLIIGGGTKDGTPIMKVEPLEKSKAPAEEKALNTKLIIATLGDGFQITYLPSSGEILKKDSSLIKYEVGSIDIAINRAKLALNYAKHDLKDKESDYKRCSYLTEKKSSSKESCETSELAYETSKNALDDCEAKLTYLIEKKALGVIIAPYDCKVTKVMLIVGGGTKNGTPIMEIEKI